MPIIAKQAGAVVIEINPEPTPLTGVISNYLIPGQGRRRHEPDHLRAGSAAVSPSPSPWVRCVALPPPSLEDNTADADRLLAALKKELAAETIDVDLDLLKQLPSVLRTAGYRIRCTVFRDRGRWLLTGIDAADDPRPAAGIAVDLGTTRVVLRLIDLATCRVLGEHAFDNPQIAVGPDVLARIHHADPPGGLRGAEPPHHRRPQQRHRRDLPGGRNRAARHLRRRRSPATPP
ncbi:MAG: hypothetical protein MZV70_03770 [Desulfobacterales bacterium]|nr:hypothetical protein [Desulfobacterales bacterium]